MAIVKTHKGCGGEVKGRRCDKCGKFWNRKSYLLSRDIEKVKPTPDKPQEFDEYEYRMRIRRGDDIRYKKKKKEE